MGIEQQKGGVNPEDVAINKPFHKRIADGIVDKLKDKRPAFIHAAREVIFRLNRLTISEESSQNLQDIKGILEDESILLIANHPGLMDTFIVLTGIMEDGEIKKGMGAAAEKHYRFKRDPFMAPFLRALPMFGVEVMPVVQTKNDSHIYPEGYKDSLNTAFLMRAKKILKQTKGQFIGLAPEGTRSENGQLIEADAGLGSLVMPDRKGNSPHIAVLGIIYKKYAENGNKGELVINRPFRLTDVISERVIYLLQDKDLDLTTRSRIATDITMLILAKTLPERMRGYYANPLEILEKYGLDNSDIDFNYFESKRDGEN